MNEWKRRLDDSISLGGHVEQSTRSTFETKFQEGLLKRFLS